MPTYPTKASLSPARRRLLKLFQQLNFGRLESLVIRDGEPVLDPRPILVREHKFGSENGPRPELGVADFLLKQQVVELFEFFDQLQDGVIDVLEIKHGLPFRLIVREVPA
jgi:hypothetical protein